MDKLGYNASKVMSDDPANRRKFPRTPLSLLVQYRFNSFEDFLAEYALNLSPGGMFIRTDEPSETGTMLHMQFSLKDGSKLIEGLGRVASVVRPGDPMQQSGMGIEFINFDAESSALINQICEGQKRKPRS